MTPAQQPPRDGGLLPALAATPEINVLRFDFDRGAALLTRLDRGQLAAASFLDDRLLRGDIPRQWVPLRSVVESSARIVDPRPLHFIFHTGHVGSTLVSRLLETVAGVLALREPFPLRQVVDAHVQAAHPGSRIDPDRLDRVFNCTLNLLRRGFADTRAVVVKATSIVGRCAPLILSRLPDSRAIYINVRPEVYIATYLANADSLRDLHPMTAERTGRLRTFGLPAAAFSDPLSDGELAAMSWLAESWARHKALAALPGRLLAVDFDALLAGLAHEVGRILRHFDLPHDAETLDRIARSPALGRYSKAQALEFSPELRTRVLRASAAGQGAEIGRGLAWLDRAAALNPEAARVKIAGVQPPG